MKSRKVHPNYHNLSFIIKMTLLVILTVLFSTACSEKQITLRILETTDVHGTILPYDFIENQRLDASLASVATYLKQVRENSDEIILLDNGDILQGQPSVYYYNFIDTTSPHLVAEALNYLRYDAATAGNHDIETGHRVYDHLFKRYNFPVLGANAIDKTTGYPYFKPFTIVEKKGIKAAIFGLITPAVPDWLPPELYRGIEFENMLASARKWMPEIQKEKPDIIIGLFHSGWDRSGLKPDRNSSMEENGSSSIAYNVPGFDIIFTGHDHREANEKIVNTDGDTVLILNGGSRSEKLAQAEIVFSSGGKLKKIKGALINVRNYKPDPDFMLKFKKNNKEISEYVNRVIGKSEKTISSRESYFGPSAFIDMVQSVQLSLTGADISFTAPLSFDVQISRGPVTVGDMFKLYRYENMLYTMKMTGSEIKKYLEYSYSLWVNTMKDPEDILLEYRTGKDGKPVRTNQRQFLLNPPYNFDSAAGIDYTVDVSMPPGKRIKIKSFSDRDPFIDKMFYKVAVNSYRGNGGGGHLTIGAGIRKDELSERLLASTDKDLRYFILKYIESTGIINPAPLNNWKMIPEKWVKKASEREYRLLFGENK